MMAKAGRQALRNGFFDSDCWYGICEYASSALSSQMVFGAYSEHGFPYWYGCNSVFSQYHPAGILFFALRGDCGKV
jgi:hypothetical protein